MGVLAKYLSHLVLTASLGGIFFFHHPQFTDGDTDVNPYVHATPGALTVLFQTPVS